MKMKLNEAYKEWKDAPSTDTYNQLGESLFRFIQATIATEFRSRYEELRDAVGEVICEIMKDIGSYDPSKGSFSNWVYGITCHTCMDMRRQKISRREQVLLENGTGSIKPTYEDRLLLKTIISKLSEEDQRLIQLKLEGHSNEEIAFRFQINTGAVKMKWIRIVDRLRTIGVGNADTSSYIGVNRSCGSNSSLHSRIDSCVR